MRLRDSTKESLVIEKAINLIVQSGIEGFSMNKLARECGISVGTLYIYYSDKDNLINSIGRKITQEFNECTLRNFSPDLSFRDGLKIQWQNRADFALNFTQHYQCFEILRNSPFAESAMNAEMSEFRDTMRQFIQRAIENRELRSLPFEAFWSVAYGPLYYLLRFHIDGKSYGCIPFELTTDTMNAAFEVVVESLKPNSK